MKQPPGLQLLHCLQTSGDGGDSVFSDSFRAASLLAIHPTYRSAWNALASYPVSYHYRAGGKAFFDTKPTIELADDVQDTRKVCYFTSFGKAVLIMI